VKAFQRVLSMNPNIVNVYNNMAVVLFKLGRMEEAQASMRKAL